MSSKSSERLDIRTSIVTAVRQFAPWLIGAGVVVFAGYPGVICITPLAWLLATRVGLVCARRSGSPTREQRVIEAALSGSIFGLLQGLLFVFLVPRLGTVSPAEKASAAWISLGMVAGGMVAGMVLAGMTAWLHENRQRRRT